MERIVTDVDPHHLPKVGTALLIKLSFCILTWCTFGSVSVAGFAAHVTAARLRCQDLDFIVVATLKAIQANFDLKGDEPGSMNNGEK